MASVLWVKYNVVYNNVDVVQYTNVPYEVGVYPYDSGNIQVYSSARVISGSIDLYQPQSVSPINSTGYYMNSGGSCYYIFDAVNGEDSKGRDIIKVNGYRCSIGQQQVPSKGTFIGYVTAADGTYPVDNHYSDGYWYTLIPSNTWKRYNVNTQSYIDDDYSQEYTYIIHEFDDITVYPSVAWNGTAVVCTGTPVTDNVNIIPSGWFDGRYFNGKYGLVRIINGHSDTETNYIMITVVPVVYKTEKTMGTYIQDVLAPVGTYPDNGIFADDGYWYVLNKNFAPTAPKSISWISKASAKKSITLNWSASTDPNLDAIFYDIDFYNGTEWISSIGRTESTSFDYVLPDIQTKNAKFRVRATDLKLYSDYTESNVFEIQRLQVLMNIDSQIKTLNNGYINIDGMLKNISNIFIKVNDTLKEI